MARVLGDDSSALPAPRRAREFVASPSAIGTILALATPMFLLYGSMLDTLQISLPIAVAFLLVRARGEVQQRPVAPWIPFALAILLVLGSWEGALLCGVYATADLVRGWRDRHRLTLSATTAGFLAGAVVLAAWFWWAAGSFEPIFDQARMRSGSGNAAIGWSSFLGIPRDLPGRVDRARRPVRRDHRPGPPPPEPIRAADCVRRRRRDARLSGVAA